MTFFQGGASLWISTPSPPSFPMPEPLNGGCAPSLTWNYPQTSWKKPRSSAPRPPGSSSPPFPTGLAAQQPQGNLSYYARGEDYHLALSRRLGQIVSGLQARFPGKTFVPGADNSPLPERQCAGWLGWAFWGGTAGHHPALWQLGVPWHHLDRSPAPLRLHPCPGLPWLQRRIRACPSGALTETGCDVARCLSDLTRRRGR